MVATLTGVTSSDVGFEAEDVRGRRVPFDRAVQLATSSLSVPQTVRDAGTAAARGIERQADVIKFFFAPPVHEQEGRFVLKQQWQGVVTSVGDDAFTVDLKDLTDPDSPEETAELLREDVDPQDLALLEPGAIFYWSIGYEDTRRGRERKSIIRFLRLPGWTATDLEAIEREAHELNVFFKTHHEGIAHQVPKSLKAHGR
jgi:hypothetical protein